VRENRRYNHETRAALDTRQAVGSK